MKKHVVNLDALQQTDIPEEATALDWQAALADSASVMADLQRFTDNLLRRMDQDTQNVMEALIQSVDDSLRRFFAPGTFYGDALLVYTQGDMQALDRLASSRYFSRRALFVDRRWYPLLDSALKDRQGDERGRRTAWLEVVRSALCIPLRQPEFAGLPVREIYAFLRGATRPEIERDLLHGSTMDSLETKAPHPPIIDDDTEEARTLDEELTTSFLDQAEMRVEALLLLKQLPPRQAQALLLHFAGSEDEQIAQQFGVQVATVRQWRSRRMKQLRKQKATFA